MRGTYSTTLGLDLELDPKLRGRSVHQWLGRLIESDDEVCYAAVTGTVGASGVAE